MLEPNPEILDNAERIFPIFFGVWVLLGAVSWYLFFFSKNVARKKLLWKPSLVVVGALFLGFMWAMGFPALIVAIAAPFVVLIMWINARTVKFCDQCGRTAMQQMPFVPSRHCAHCGAAFT